ncbi:MAG TPA: alpha/beta fold hydrolase [Anaerolineales bacterium]|nr:alpha/beta fold hydrolase [Anaerolineales bacterium]
MSVVVLNQSVLHFETLGRGRPVLFLHTWVGSWRYWVPSLQAVAVSHSAYALDLLGFGDSARNAVGYSLDGQTALVAAFLDEMGIGRVALVGHGLGGLVGLHFADQQPDRVARMLIAGLSPRSIARDARLGLFSPDEWLTLFDAKGAFAAELLPETRGIDPDAVHVVPNEAETSGFLAAPSEADPPILFINGANDPLQGAADATHIPPTQRRVQEIVFPESGHFPMLDAPDAFHRLMVDFLALDDGASPRDLRLKEEWRRRVR